MHKYISEIRAALPENGICRNNMIAVFLMGALPAAGGSVISVILYACFVWAILSLAFGRFDFNLTRSDRMLAWTFTFFAVIIVATALAGDRAKKAPHELVWLLGFLSPWVLIPRLRARSSGNYLMPYITGAAVGAIIACAVALFQLKIAGIRPEAGAGNPAVFAIMSLCIMSLGALNINCGSRRRRIMGASALLFGSLAVLLSLTRGVALVLPPMILLLLIYARVSWRSVLSWPIVLLAIVVGLVIFNTASTLDLRAHSTLGDLERVLHGDLASGVGLRLHLWSGSVEAIVRSPIWGFGIQNRMDVVMPLLKQDGFSVPKFSHAHNGFLTFTLDGGILALVALIAMTCVPVIIALRAPRDENYEVRLFMGLMVTGAYLLCGMTQIMFKHDIMDSFFIFFAIVLAASVPDDAAEGRSSKSTKAQTYPDSANRHDCAA